MSDPVPPELAGLSEAEEFFEALGIDYEPKVLQAHRLQILKVFGLAVASWLETNPTADASERRTAMATALQQTHDVFAEEARFAERCNPFAPGLVQLGRRR